MDFEESGGSPNKSGEFGFFSKKISGGVERGGATSIRDLRVLKMLEGYASCMCWMHKRCSAVVEVN